MDGRIADIFVKVYAQLDGYCCVEFHLVMKYGVN